MQNKLMFKLAVTLSASLVLAACGESSTTPPPMAHGLSFDERTSEVPNLDEGEAPLPEIGIDPGVFEGRAGEDVTDLTALAAAPRDAAGQAVFLTCRNEPSGPYYRLQTDPAKTGAVNFIEGTAHLPPVQAIPTSFPYLYLGGQPRQGVAADAGVYVHYDGAWIPFIGVERYGQRNLPRETDAQGNVFVYRLSGGQDAAMRLYVQNDDELRLDVTGAWVKYQLKNGALSRVGEAGTSTRTVVHPLAPGWKAGGEDQVYKAMTTIAFPGKGRFELLSGTYTFLGSSWRDLGVGQLNAPGEGSRRLPFTKGRLYSACAAPHDVVTPAPTSALPRANAEIRLRRAARFALPLGSTFDLSAKVKHTVRSEISLANTGVEGSFVRYALTPLGREEATKPESGALASGETSNVAFAAICDKEPGDYQKTFDVLYSAGETFTATSAPSALPNAKPGDLLYRSAPVAVNLSCTENQP